MSAGPDLADERAFEHWTVEKIRFQDVDRQDHVNNVNFAVYAESGRLEFLHAIAPDPGADPGAGAFWVIARLTIDFRAQLRYPGEVRIGTRVLSLGRTSVTLGQGLFAAGVCVATAESVLVQVDPATGRGVPLTDAQRAAAGGGAAQK